MFDYCVWYCKWSNVSILSFKWIYNTSFVCFVVVVVILLFFILHYLAWHGLDGLHRLNYVYHINECPKFSVSVTFDICCSIKRLTNFIIQHLKCHNLCEWKMWETERGHQQQLKKKEFLSHIYKFHTQHAYVYKETETAK